MKTTLDIDDELLRRAKQAALERNTTLRAIVEEALARSLGPADAQDIPLRTITWPPEHALPAGPALAADDVMAAIAAERSDPADDRQRLARRVGAAVAAWRRRK